MTCRCPVMKDSIHIVFSFNLCHEVVNLELLVHQLASAIVIFFSRQVHALVYFLSNLLHFPMILLDLVISQQETLLVISRSLIIN